MSCSYIKSIEYELGAPHLIESIPELQRQPDLLEYFSMMGLERYCLEAGEPWKLALRSINNTLANSNVNKADIDIILIGTTTFWQEKFYRREHVSQLAHEAGLSNAYPYCVSFSECANLHSVFRLGDALLTSGQAKTIIAVVLDVTSPESTRIVPPTVGIKSDGAASFIMDTVSEGYEIKAISQSVQHDLYDIDTHIDVGKYLKRVADGVMELFESLLNKSNISVEDIKYISMNNYNLSVLRTFSHVLGIPLNQFWLETLPEVAHVISSDNLINLSDMDKKKKLGVGDLIMLIGTGPHLWGGTLFEKVSEQ